MGRRHEQVLREADVAAPCCCIRAPAQAGALSFCPNSFAFRAGTSPRLLCLAGQPSEVTFAQLNWRFAMLYWALVFLIVALVAGALGFGGIAGASAGIAKILFFVFLVLLVISLVTHLMWGAAP